MAGANVAAEASLCLFPLIKLPATRVQAPSESPGKISSKSLTWLQHLEGTGQGNAHVYIYRAFNAV